MSYTQLLIMQFAKALFCKAWARSCFHKSWHDTVLRKEATSKGVIPPGRITKAHAQGKGCLPGTEGTLHMESVLRQVTQEGPIFDEKNTPEPTEEAEISKQLCALFLLNERKTAPKVTISIWRCTKRGHLGKSKCTRPDGACFLEHLTAVLQVDKSSA